MKCVVSFASTEGDGTRELVHVEGASLFQAAAAARQRVYMMSWFDRLAWIEVRTAAGHRYFVDPARLTEWQRQQMHVPTQRSLLDVTQQSAGFDPQ